MEIAVNYKIYNLLNFEEHHKDYFNSLLEVVKKNNLLSLNIDEIIFTDDIQKELKNFETPFLKPNLTISREFKAIAKIVDFEGIKKIFFDARFVNKNSKFGIPTFMEQLVQVYAEDLITMNYNISRKFFEDNSLTEHIEKLFFEWSIITTAKLINKSLTYEKILVHTDVDIYINAFKRNIRKLHYQYQKDMNLQVFWLKIVFEVDAFIRRCIDVKFDSGNFENLTEFQPFVSKLLEEIETQTFNILNEKGVNIAKMKEAILGMLEICYIKISEERPFHIKIMDTPKRLFKGNIIDTEPRIVAFIDILGFSAIINEYDSDSTSNLLNELHETLEQAIKVSIENIKNQQAQTDLKEFLEYRMFSDCICISIPYIEFGNDFHVQFHSLAYVVKSYQFAMMQKGFFVRGGISIGSFFADTNMIFSGGLVQAYKLEITAIYPIIVIEKKILERLNENFIKNSENLFFEDLLIFSKSNAEKTFLNPFEILDNSKKYLDYLITSLDDIIKENEGEIDDAISQMTNSFLQLTKSITAPIFELTKSQMSAENIKLVKEEILNHINRAIEKHELIMNQNLNSVETEKEMKKIISKYTFLKSLIEWSMGENNDFSKYTFAE